MLDNYLTIETYHIEFTLYSPACTVVTSGSIELRDISTPRHELACKPCCTIDMVAQKQQIL